MKSRATDPEMLRLLLKPLQEYIESNLGKEPEPPKKEPAKHSEIRYSLAEPIYDDERIKDLQKFLSEASKDTAMFNTPALEKTYRRWEKENAVTKTFSSEIIRILKETRTRPAEFYKAAGIDKRVYSSMKRDYCYTPSRTTAIKCCFALRLSPEKAEQLLKLAGYSLAPGLSKDLAIRFCLENSIYDITSVNYMLEALGETPLA